MKQDGLLFLKKMITFNINKVKYYGNSSIRQGCKID